MTDNLNVTPSGSTPVATDEISNVHYQRVKLTDGTADSSTVIAAGAGSSTNALRVSLANDITVPVLEAVTTSIQWTNVSKEYTTVQGAANVVATDGTKKIYIGSVRLSTGYVSSATRISVVLYLGTGSYVAGTDQIVWAGEFVTIPATNVESYPGVVIGNGAAPFTISAAGDALKITTSASTYPKLYLSVDYVQV